MFRDWYAAAPGSLTERLQAFEPLLRLSFASEIIYQIIEIFIALALYRLFKDTHRGLATQMLVLGLMPVPIVLANELMGYAALSISGAASSLSDSAAAHEAMAGLFYELRETGLLIASLFWGLWLLPLGRLVRLSGFFPKLLGLIVITGGLGYILRIVTNLVLVSFIDSRSIETLNLAASIMMIGEVPIIPALLWFGFRKK